MAAQTASQVDILKKILGYFELAATIGEVVPEPHVQAISALVETLSAGLLNSQLVKQQEAAQAAKQLATAQAAQAGPVLVAPAPAIPPPAPSPLAGSPFDPHTQGKSGPGIDTSAPEPVDMKLASPFTFNGKLYRDDLPTYLRASFFATPEMASALAAYVGGIVYTEGMGDTPGSGVPALFIRDRVDENPSWKPWNAGDLYEYLQSHPTYHPFA